MGGKAGSRRGSGVIYQGSTVISRQLLGGGWELRCELWKLKGSFLFFVFLE